MEPPDISSTTTTHPPRQCIHHDNASLSFSFNAFLNRDAFADMRSGADAFGEAQKVLRQPLERPRNRWRVAQQLCDLVMDTSMALLRLPTRATLMGTAHLTTPPPPSPERLLTPNSCALHSRGVRPQLGSSDEWFGSHSSNAHTSVYSASHREQRLDGPPSSAEARCSTATALADQLPSCTPDNRFPHKPEQWLCITRCIADENRDSDSTPRWRGHGHCSEGVQQIQQAIAALRKTVINLY